VERAEQIRLEDYPVGNPAILLLGIPATQKPELALVGRGARFSPRNEQFFWAEVAKSQGRSEKRLEYLRLALQCKPSWGSPEILEDALADGYFETGRIDEAIVEYERALRLFPGMAMAHYHLGQAYLKKGSTELARAQFRQFLDLWKNADPDLPELAYAKSRVRA
jgi:tetratricopeptide (TPR) repeat protein